MIVPLKHLNYADIFLEAFAAELSEHISINDYFINLVDNKQPLYSQIYSLELVELKTLKTYIKINLANSFIWPFQLLAGIPILLIKKKDDSFQLYVNYLGFNNLTLKDWYSLPLSGEFLDCLDYTKYFT